MHPSGFGQITVTTSGKYNDTTQMYAAGYVEGALTQMRLWQHASNMLDYMRASLGLNDTAPLPDVFEKFYADNSDWVRSNVASNSSALWTQVGFMISQLDGLLDGYNSAAPASEQITPFHLHAVNAIGDFLTLGSALMPGSRMDPEWNSMTDAEMKAALSLRGHCSALISVTGNLSTLFNAQGESGRALCYDHATLRGAHWRARVIPRRTHSPHTPRPDWGPACTPTCLHRARRCARRRLFLCSGLVHVLLDAAHQQAL